MPMRRMAISCQIRLGLACLFLLIGSACLLSKGQRFHDFRLQPPVKSSGVLMLGFLGGREPWDSEHSAVRRLALKLRRMNLPGLHVETVENKKRDLALQLIRRAFDFDGDGELSQEEKQGVRLILFGQSFGGAAVVKLARQLRKEDIPVLLSIQVDSIGIGDEEIPSNVDRAANLFQQEGLFIRGESEIHAEDPEQTEIIGNFEFSHEDQPIDISEVPWHKKLFRVAHTRMNFDPRAWQKVEQLILSTIRSLDQSSPDSND